MAMISGHDKNGNPIQKRRTWRRHRRRRDGGGLQGVGDVRLVELVRVLAVPGAFNYRPLSGGLLSREVEPEPPESRLKVLMHGSPYTETSFLIMSPIRFKSHLKFSLFSFIRMDKVVLV